MLVLVLAVLLLVVAPGLLLLVGRAIQRVTDGHHVLPEAGSGLAPEPGDAWYRRGMRPLFYRAEEEESEACIGPL